MILCSSTTLPASRLSICTDDISWDGEVSLMNTTKFLPASIRRRKMRAILCSAAGEESSIDRPKRVPWNKGLKMVPGQSKTRSTEEQLKVEELRRQRISTANKGRLPWNTGRKHPPETIKRIRERTLEAMKDPKIREKLRGFQQSLSADVKAKISIAVHEHWVRKLKELGLQKQCLLEWQNCIAEAARRGGDNEEELQWDSYAAEKQREREEAKQLKEEARTASKSQRRLEWSDEHRRKVSEAIKAKWQSQEYRERVMDALKLRSRNTIRPPRPARPSRVSKPRKPAQLSVSVSHRRAVRIDEKFVSAVMAGEQKEDLKIKKAVKVNGVANPRFNKSSTEKSKTQLPSVPTFVDSRASEKTEKLRQLRASRLVIDAKKNDAAERAKMLMAEAEAAAKALEAIAFKDQFAMASLLETRKLLAEAARSIKAVEGSGDKSVDSGGIDEIKEVADQVPDESLRTNGLIHESIDEQQQQHVTKTDEDTCTKINVENKTLQETATTKKIKRWHCGRLVYVDE